jgi:hypothetical protein
VPKLMFIFLTLRSGPNHYSLHSFVIPEFSSKRNKSARLSKSS